MDELLPQVYEELRRLAHRHMAREREEHTLQTTALVNEAFLRLQGHHRGFSDRKEFLAAAANTMRRVLVDHARGRDRLRRGGPDRQRITLSGLSVEAPEVDILDLDRALEALAELDERKARAVEMFYFSGLDYDDIAAALNLSPATAKRDLQFARAWLKKTLSHAAD